MRSYVSVNRKLVRLMVALSGGLVGAYNARVTVTMGGHTGHNNYQPTRLWHVSYQTEISPKIKIS